MHLLLYVVIALVWGLFCYFGISRLHNTEYSIRRWAIVHAIFWPLSIVLTIAAHIFMFFFGDKA